jgi:hypothetical protein
MRRSQNMLMHNLITHPESGIPARMPTNSTNPLKRVDVHLIISIRLALVHAAFLFLDKREEGQGLSCPPSLS